MIIIITIIIITIIIIKTIIIMTSYILSKAGQSSIYSKKKKTQMAYLSGFQEISGYRHF